MKRAILSALLFTSVPAWPDQALHQAVSGGTPRQVREILARGVNPDALDSAGETPLHSAIWRLIEAKDPIGLQVAAALLTYGADPDSLDRSGRTPLNRAVSARRGALVELLLTMDADADIPDPLGQTPLFMAAMLAFGELIQVLLAHGASPNLADALLGNTPLHMVAYHGDTTIAAALLKHGADPHLPNREGVTPLELARGNPSLARLLSAD